MFGYMRKRNPNSKLRKIVISNVKYYREKVNMSQEELSLKLNRKENFIERLEANQTKIEPTILLVDEIAHIFNIPTEYLVLEREKNDH